jgi:hypothetical protein
MGGMETGEFTLDEALEIIEEWKKNATVIVNKRTGEVIDKISPDVEEILIIQIVGGG